MADLSQLSDEELVALKRKQLEAMSDEDLLALRKQLEPDPGADVAQSFIAGVRDIPSAFAGMFGDVQRGLGGEQQPISKTQQMQMENRSPAPPSGPDPRLHGRSALPTNAMAPSTQDFNRMQGNTYQSQTPVGNVARTAGAFSVNALFPGSGLMRGARVVVPTVTSEIAGESAKGTPYEQPARVLGGMVGIGGAELARGRGAPPSPVVETLGDIDTIGAIEASGQIRGPDMGKLGDALNSSNKKRAQIATEKEAYGLGKEFGIDMRKGQRTGSPADIAFEQSALRGAEGDSAYNILKEHDARQGSQVKNAADNIATRGQPKVAGNQYEASGIAREGLDAAATAAKAAENEAWDAFRASPGAVKVKGLASLSSRIEQSIRDFDINPDLGMDSYRQSGAALDRVRRQVAMLVKSGREEVPISELNQIRKSISDAGRAANNDADKAVAGRMNKAVNDWLDDVSTTALFDGDTSVIENLNKARQATRDYHEHFGSDKLLGKIIERSADEKQTINALFGAAKIGSPKGAVEAVSTMKRVLGEDSKSVQALREAAIMRIMEPIQKADRQGAPASYGAAIENLNDALSGSGRPVMSELFTAEELSKLRRLQMAIQRLNPPAGTVNYSGTAYEAKRAAVRTISDLVGKFGRVPVLDFFLKGLVDAHSGMKATSVVRMQEPKATAIPQAPTGTPIPFGAIARGSAYPAQTNALFQSDVRQHSNDLLK